MKNNSILNTPVQGSLSTLLHGLPKDKKILRSLEGKLPIRDNEDKIIGYVTRIDLENDIWYGYIRNWCISEPSSTSMSLEF